ncbi:interphotoreceptor matrix proteoglycan 2 isoform X1 [Synchiropus splendidus]|uniref:interphotoreceptor matrix proteoglycan 2 isoform X1 n=1 Tax=Synchiropus splendidus TaxID=270530 RepID=UPI00237EA3F3|nr:interphotoreceptor matrix proteoglycan 2 isoform X1 [Synchiropus splendidus]
MCAAMWRCVFYSLLFSLASTFLDVRPDATLEGSALDLLPEEPAALPRIVSISDIRATHEGRLAVARRKRNILFPSGVKLCARETVEQVIGNHLSYFHLRVCQETIWESFKIFWDRLPEQEEYQSWLARCQEGSVTAHDIGRFFSQSEEHQALVKKRVSQQSGKSEPTRSWQHMCSPPTQAPKTPVAPDTETEGAKAVPQEEEDEAELDNDISMPPHTAAALEQVVELSIILNGEMYSDDLDDPRSHHYQALSRKLTDKIAESLEELPGFKSVTVLNFKPQKDDQGLHGVVVDYSVTVAVDSSGISAEQVDYLTLQSNRVEDSYLQMMELPTVVLKPVLVSEELPKDDLESVSEIPVAAADRVTVYDSDEPPEVSILEEEFLSESYDVKATPTTGSDVVVLAESVVVSTESAHTIAEPEPEGITEEDLLLEEKVETPAAVEIPKPEELPAEVLSHELHETMLLPEPPLEIEASGSGTDDLSDLLWPTTEEESEEGVSEDVALTDVILDDDSEGHTEDVSDDGTTVEVLEEHSEESDVQEELEISTISTETIEEESLPALIPPPDAAEVLREEPSLPPVEAAVMDQESVVEEATESSAHNVPTTAVAEILVAVDVPPESPQISTQDLTEDEIILVNQEEAGPPSVSPVQPTVLSPERESPFTRVSDVNPAPDEHPEIFITSVLEIQTTNEGLEEGALEEDFDVFHYGLMNHTEEGSTGFPFGVSHGTDRASISMPANPGRALMVFFSLRVTNMIFSDDLFNKSSPEYKALEQRFLELLVPYLQSNLSNFENLEILNFRNGSIVVNSRMKFGKPVPRGVTSTVYLILEDFCNTAYQTMNLAIDKYSLDVESGDQADPCKFQACNEYAECKVNKWSGEAECVCNAGYFSVDGLPCQSICELQTDFCLNDGKCDIIPGQGAICRCRVGENWWYRGEHCEEYVSEPLVVGIAVASVAGFLLVASGVIFFLARTLRDQYDKDESEDPIRGAESLPSLERATKYNPMYESEATTGYSHYYRRYPDCPVYSSASAEASTDFSSEEIRHIYENSELTKEEIQDRIRIIELYTKDRQFADFVRQHQAVLDTRRESSST